MDNKLMEPSKEDAVFQFSKEEILKDSILWEESNKLQTLKLYKEIINGQI